jgi:hypothetical protein
LLNHVRPRLLPLVLAVVFIPAPFTAVLRGQDAKAIDDQTIVDGVNARLFADPTLKTRDIRVSSRDSVVTLQGSVISRNEEAAADRIASTEPGVTKVVDSLAVTDDSRPATVAVPSKPEADTAPGAVPISQTEPMPKRVRWQGKVYDVVGEEGQNYILKLEPESTAPGAVSVPQTKTRPERVMDKQGRTYQVVGQQGSNYVLKPEPEPTATSAESTNPYAGMGEDISKGAALDWRMRQQQAESADVKAQETQLRLANEKELRALYDKYASETDPGRRADIENQIRVLRGIISGAPTEEAGSGTVDVSAEPPSAEIYVDGQFVGNSPAALNLSVGPHTIQLKAPGRKIWERKFRVLKDSHLTLKGTLEKEG